jgi:chromosome segregation ATPase
MKIHFLEQAMSQRGTDFNKAALKENTDLKVNRITMQRELHKFKKNIAQAERDAEVYRLQLEDYRDRMRKKHADESVRIETERLQTELTTKETVISKLQDELRSAQHSDDVVQRLRAELGDLEADLREKDRLIEEREDEIDSLKHNAGKESNAAAELEDELDTAKRQVEELQEDLDRAANEATNARKEREDAVEDKTQAENNLEELREEMMNKSFTTKGLSRQLEEKTTKLEDQVEELQGKHSLLQQELEEKARNERVLQERLRVSEKEGASRDKLHAQLDLANREKVNLKRDLEKMSTKLQSAVEDFESKSEEKDLLQSRHDALTSESANLQSDLSKTQRSVEELEQALDQERQHAAHNDNYLRSQHKTEVDLLTEQIDSLHREVNAKASQLASDHEDWESQRRTLESASQRAEEKADGLQRTVSKLQEVEGTLSGRDIKLQEALESEKQRHKQEEERLHRQIQELNEDMATKKTASHEQRTELSNAREELRISIREQAALKEKVEQLEEEIEVLQANLEEEAEYAEEQRNKSVEEVDAQLQKVRKEKQALQDQLANTNIELHGLKKMAKDVQAERDDLEAKLIKADKSVDDTFNIDQEKRELRRSKQRLEKDLERLHLERDSLQDANVALEQEINAEIDRANAEEIRLNLEIDQLRNKQLSASDSRDRELTSAKNKVQRLETRVAELEERLENQTRNVPSPGLQDVSLLQHDLAESRRKESASLQRETTLKSTTRDLKSQIATLERDLHELQIAKLNASPQPQSSPSLQKDLTKARADLLSAQTSLQALRSENRHLEQQISKSSVHETERADLHALVKSSTIEAEALAVKLSSRDNKLSELKIQLKRLRGEREKANARAEATARELDALQERHESILEKVSAAQGPGSGSGGNGGVRREKEMRGLMKEVVWLRARCRREEGFRRDLAWSKGFMEMGEGMRSAWYVCPTLTHTYLPIPHITPHPYLHTIRYLY